MVVLGSGEWFHFWVLLNSSSMNEVTVTISTNTIIRRFPTAAEFWTILIHLVLTNDCFYGTPAK